MTISELIKELEKYDGNTKVNVYGFVDDEGGYVMRHDVCIGKSENPPKEFRTIVFADNGKVADGEFTTLNDAFNLGIEYISKAKGFVVGIEEGDCLVGVQIFEYNDDGFCTDNKAERNLNDLDLRDYELGELDLVLEYALDPYAVLERELMGTDHAWDI